MLCVLSVLCVNSIPLLYNVLAIMEILLLILLAVTIIAFLLGLIHHFSIKRQVHRGELEATPEIVYADDADCCGAHDACDKERVLQAFAAGEMVYYDDEELDRFAGRGSSEYTSEEEEEFREVFTTLQEREAKGWMISLQLRGIEVPDGLKDELALVVHEHEMH